MPIVETPAGAASYVTEDEVRSLPKLADASKFSSAEIAAATTWFEDKFEEYSGVAWTARTASEWASGRGSATLFLRRYPVIVVESIEVYSTATAFVPFTVDELADLRISDTGQLRRVSLGTFDTGAENLLVTYVHGVDPTPTWVKDAALMAIGDKLQADLSAARARTQYATQTDLGIVRTSMPGPDRPFGIPAVDEAANRARMYRVPAMA